MLCNDENEFLWLNDLPRTIITSNKQTSDSSIRSIGNVPISSSSNSIDSRISISSIDLDLPIPLEN